MDELYDALAEVMGAAEETLCYKTYFLVRDEYGLAFQYSMLLSQHKLIAIVVMTSQPEFSGYEQVIIIV